MKYSIRWLRVNRSWSKQLEIWNACHYRKKIKIQVFFFFSKNTRNENLNYLISAYLNINTIGNKFDFPAEQVQWKTDILIISKTKINESFPQANFLIDGLSSPYKLDCHSKSGGDIPSNFLASYNTPIDELNLQNVNRLFL